MSSRPSSTHSRAHASENTPLLSNQDDESHITYDEANGATSPAESSLRSLQPSKSGRRLPTIIALAVLSLAVVAILGLAFAAPVVVQEYVKEALVFEPEKVSIDSFTAVGVRARIQGTFWLDASKVHKKSVRDLGRAGTYIAKEVESGASHVEVYLPEYGNVLLGKAALPPVKFNIRNKHYNHIDIVTDLEPGDVEGIRRVANDWVDGRLSRVAVEAVAHIPVKSGLFKLGTQSVTTSLVVGGEDIPTMPDVELNLIRVAEYGPPGKPHGMKALASALVKNDYPVSLDVPPLGFEVLLPDCFGGRLPFGTARTDTLHIQPKQLLNVSVTGIIQQLPTSLTAACPGSDISPLDSFVGGYLKGKETVVYIRGGEQDKHTPDWIGKLLQDTVVPFPVPSHPFDNLIKNFTLLHPHLSLPDPMAEPDAPESKPRISATVKVVVGLPKDLDFNIDCDKVRADADVFYKGKRMGKLDLRKWQKSKTKKVEHDLLVEAVVDDAPLDITDGDVFSTVVQQMVFGGKGVELAIEAKVDVSTKTALGEFVVRQIPSKGKVLIKPVGMGGDFEMPQVMGLEVVDTSPTALTVEARVNMTNPTDYSTHIPHVNVSLWVNETRFGYAWMSGDIVPGLNVITSRASFETSAAGREFMSQFISGYNTSLTIRSHAGSIPFIPDPGLSYTVAVPHMFGKSLKDTTV